VTSPEVLTPRAERKFAVALFADLSGYTALCQRLDPEDVDGTVRPLMAALRAAVAADGGVVVNVAGDGFFAIYGVPVALADAGNRAVRSAVAMRRLVAERNAREGEVRVPDVHVGLAAGEVLVVPSDDPSGWSLVGSAVNLASRLCDEARAGEILVDVEMKALLETEVGWESSRTLELRGHDGAVRAWEIGEASSAETVSRSPVPFVGRQEVITGLDEALQQTVATRRSSVVYIRGQPGIGKSRLLDQWVGGHAHLDPLRLWCGRSLTGLQLDRLLEMLVEPVGGTASGLATLRPFGAGPDPDPAVRVDPFPMVVAGVRRLLGDAGRRRPTVVVIDDLQAADPSLADFIADLRTDPVDAPVLVVCSTLTDDASDPLPGDVELGPLAEDDVATILSAALGAAAPPSVLSAVASRVAGHPLMTMQSAAYLLEAGVVTVAHDRCDVVAPAAVDVLPTSLRMFVGARIDRLPAAEKALLQELSTFGDEIRADEVVALLGDPAARHLDELERRRLLTRGDDSAVRRFSHGLVQEVAYGTLPRSTRANLHRRHLQLLPDSDRHDERVFHATSWARSLGVGDRKALAEATTVALREALAHSRMLFRTQARSAHAAIVRVRELMADGTALAPDVTAALLTLDAQCLIELGRFDDALQAASQALEIVRAGEDDAQRELPILLVQAHAMSRLRRFQGARQTLDLAASMAESSGDVRARAQALRLMGETWRHSIVGRFTELTEAAYETFTTAGDTAGAAECARTLAYLHAPSPLYERWRSLAGEHTDADDLRGASWLARADALACYARRDLTAATAAARRAVDLGEQAGSTDAVADGLMTLAESAVSLGDLAGAHEAQAALLALATRTANPRMRLVASTVGVLAQCRRGDLASCEEEIEAIQKDVTDYGSPARADVSMAVATVARDRGRWSAAAAAVDAATEALQGSALSLSELAARAERLRIAVELPMPPQPAEADALEAACRDAGAPRLASYVAAIGDLARVRHGVDHLSPPQPDLDAEEAAIRADVAALRVEHETGQARKQWAAALQRWEPLGLSVWLARAQARSGDAAAAERTLAHLGAPPEARAWAFDERPKA
jgi:class 3 adenylate cyclase/tetratricopeptide (TPR) repeat protein